MNPAQTERLRRAHARLAEAVEALTASDGWRQMLTVAARFPTYSPHNVLLIGIQRPDATRVAGYKAWQSLGRNVRKGERGIAIIAPCTYRRDPGGDVAASEATAEEVAEHGETARELRGYRVVHVFDIAQTDGDPLPDADRPQLLSGAAPTGLWNALAVQVRSAGFTVGVGECAPANGVTDYLARSVVVQDGLPGAQRVKTLAHELGHVLLHDPKVRPVQMDRARAEVEAESVAYLVAAAHGLDSNDYSVPYVAGWAGGATGLVLESAERVLSTASRILHQAPPAGSPSAPADGPDRPTAPVVAIRPERHPRTERSADRGRRRALAVER